MSQAIQVFRNLCYCCQLILIVVFLTSCKDDSVEPVAVRLTVATDSVAMTVGDTTQLTGTVRDGNGEVVQRPIAWSVSDSAVVSVSTAGVLRAHTAGHALVIANVDASADTVPVTVYNKSALITSVMPALIEIGTPGAVLTVMGGPFLRGSTVEWNGRSQPTTYVDSLHLSAAISASDLADFITAKVTVVNPAARDSAISGVSVIVGLTPAANEKRISAGLQLTCALDNSDQAYCWGLDDGRFGNSQSLSSSATPVPAANGLRFERISTAGGIDAQTDYTGACALTIEGVAYCWGDGSSGQLGNGGFATSPIPVPVAGGHTFVDIAVARSHACAVTTAGDAYCWGDGYNGNLGDGRRGLPGGDSIKVAVPQLVPGAYKFVAVTAGNYQSCGLTRDGGVYCWGLVGGLGDGEAAEVGATSSVRGPVAVNGGNRYARIASGNGDFAQTCALTFEGDIACWGSVPSAVSIGQHARAITVGGEHACAIAADGSAYCWGNNRYGQLGLGFASAFAESIAPARVLAPLPVRAISAGITHSCALLGDAHAYCWGDREYGVLGDGTSEYSTQFTPVASSAAFQSVAVGHDFACAVDVAKRAWCWGSNSNGQLGNGRLDGPDKCFESACSMTPSPVAGLPAVERVKAGFAHACALTADGQAYCWGLNAAGQLGDGSNTTRATAVAVSGAERYRALAAASHTCGLTLGGKVLCWGSNSEGELGNGTFTSSNIPAPIASNNVPSEQFTAVTTGGIGAFSCALRSDGQALCWGDDQSGELGFNSTQTCHVADPHGPGYDTRCSNIPVSAAPGFQFDTLTAGNTHVCGRRSGAMFCWGGDSSGQLGGTAAPNTCQGPITSYACSATPLRVGGIAPAMASAGFFDTCVLTDTGASYCWGRISDTSGVSPLDPGANRIGAGAYKQISSGSSNVCAIGMDDRLYCLGSNASGALGNGVAPFQSTPVRVSGSTLF